MAKYRTLTPVKTADGITHPANQVIELTDQEAANCLSFHAVELVQETFIQSEPATSKEAVEDQDNIVSPESDVR